MCRGCGPAGELLHVYCECGWVFDGRRVPALAASDCSLRTCGRRDSSRPSNHARQSEWAPLAARAARSLLRSPLQTVLCCSGAGGQALLRQLSRRICLCCSGGELSLARPTQEKGRRQRQLSLTRAQREPIICLCCSGGGVLDPPQAGCCPKSLARPLQERRPCSPAPESRQPPLRQTWQAAYCEGFCLRCRAPPSPDSTSQSSKRKRKKLEAKSFALASPRVRNPPSKILWN